jgi:hypothetical protein
MYCVNKGGKIFKYDCMDKTLPRFKLFLVLCLLYNNCSCIKKYEYIRISKYMGKILSHFQVYVPGKIIINLVKTINLLLTHGVSSTLNVLLIFYT